MQLAMHDRQYSAIKNNVSSNACGNRLPHRRRKILKVGGLKICLSARSAREKFQTTPILGQTAPICERSTSYIQCMLMYVLDVHYQYTCNLISSPLPCCISLQSPLPLLWRLQLLLTVFMSTLALPCLVRLCFFLFSVILNSLSPSANAFCSL